ncbi:AAA family ATPase [Pseudoalteromonas fenneropenaei]|uniref:Chromosome partition protein Smc n=1 Tax=Pseudoalteromonas fenneropenaei TaxID=1737459 RepID=A0ABV7CEH1_9GAMM
MRLSSIKLAGFKSFVEPTKIPFPDQMTCVVGPNGCGKSNVIDAVRWVLGESSAKNLRGDAMTDVIFNGSTHRKPVSQASVELHFDNTSGQLPGTFAERNHIAIKRVVTRDGQSLYYLNGSKCRRRDITDIFLGTGLGPRSYAIIEQGMISRLIESKPQELRVFLEEAAGVSKYKERRKETQTRIKSTRDNLERLLDVRQELQNQLSRLSVQAKDAATYRELKAEERTLKAQLAVLKWQSLHQQQLIKSEQINALQGELDFLKTAHGGHEDVLGALETEVRHFADALTVMQQAQHRTHMELAKAEQQKLHLNDKLRSLQINIDSQVRELAQAQELVAVQTEHVDDIAMQVELVLEDVAIAQAERDDLMQHQATQQESLRAVQQQAKLAAQALLQSREAVQQGQASKQHLTLTMQHLTQQREQLVLQQQQMAADDPSEMLAAAQQQQRLLTQQMAKSQQQGLQLEQHIEQQQQRKQQQEQQHTRLQQQITELSAKQQALQTVLEEQTEHGASSFLAELRVVPGFEIIVERALLGFTDLMPSAEAAANAVWALSSVAQPGSVATLVESGIYPAILNHIQWCPQGQNKHSKPSGNWLLAIDEAGCLYGENFAQSLPAGDSKLRQYQTLREISVQLPQLAAEQQAAAQQIQQLVKALQAEHAKLAENRLEVHDLAQQIAANKTRIGLYQEQQQQFIERSKVLLQQQQHLDLELQAQNEQLEALEMQLANQHKELAQGQVQADVTQQALEQAERAVQDAVRQAQQHQQKLHDLDLQAQRVRSDLALAQAKLTHLQDDIQSAGARIEQYRDEQSDCQEPLLELELRITELLTAHSEQQAQVEKLTEQQQSARDTLSDKQALLKNASSQQTQLQEQLQVLKLDEQGLLLKAQAALEPLNELGQTLKAVLDTLPDTADANKHQSRLSFISKTLNELGAVNLAAIDEFSEAQTRQQYLDGQLNDLTQALEMLEGAIRKIDRETKARFKQTFDQVNQDLSELFPKVFGGGSAYLELTSDDMLESGVTIMARPPGKKNSTIHLLSGGEKALTALSLVFSIFRLNPAPFCMLDEVDAPLDDANVGRFCRLVEEMSQSVQFIYISHNKVAMEMAGRLTGVTMAEPGVSRMVAVDIDQAVQMAQT